MQSILVTGGAGFVGSSLALGLKARFGAPRVVALDNLRRRGSELNLSRLRAGGVDFLHGDIRVAADLEEAGGFDLLIECSAEPSVLAGFQGSPRYVIDTNLTGTLNCLEAARRHGAALIFLSTSRVYPLAALRGLACVEAETRLELAPDQSLAGASARGVAEDFPLEGSRSLYGATKLASELMMLEYLAMYGLRGIVNRCGVLTGPWQMGKADQGVVVLWAARHLYGGPLSYIGFGGQGKQVRDILHIDDLTDLIYRQIDQLDALSGRTFNVGGGRPVSVSLRELTALCAAETGRSMEIGSELADRPADVPLYLTDHARVTEATGWRPELTAEATVASVCRWIRDHRDLLAPVLG
ncbi:MAG: NAD-dependent epimerase/dehydratase family protein [Candidatus Hydrogenedentes bacterium]|nr:NAD-dependent epimerase/dehydratase family protein [Candidatus Hydrogenedentota bacterium]